MFNMKTMVLRELVNIAAENPDLSVGEVLYSVLRPKNFRKATHRPHDIKFLRELEDVDILTAIESTLKELKEEC